MASYRREATSGRSGESRSSSSTTKSGNAVRKGGHRVRRNEKGETELHRACISGDYNAVERLLSKGHPVNEKDHGGWTPLHEACNWGFVQIVRLLIEHGANIEARGMGNVTPLLDASANGQFDIMDLLLNAGASVAAVDGDGNTVLDLLETYKRNADGLCQADEDEYQRLTKLLEERMKKDGIPLHRIARSQNSRMDLASSRQSDKRGAAGTRPGVDFYVSAISSIGRSGARKAGAVFNYETFNAARRSRRGVASTSSSKPALVSENEYEVLEDWMIDDLNGHYIRSDPCEPKKRSRIRGSQDSSPALSDDAERSPNGSPASPVPVNVDELFDAEMPGVEEIRSRAAPRTSRDSDDGDLLLIGERRGRSPKRRRLRQTRLVTIATPPPTSSDDLGFVGHDDAVIEVVEPARSVSIAAPSAEAQSTGRAASELVRVNVLVDGRKFAVIMDHRYHTIEWLADKVSSNYESATGKRPVIRLYTADDAALNASDTVEFLFYQNEQLIGKVERIDMLPMEDNYRQVCQRQKYEPYGDVCDVLRNAGQSTVLDLRQTCLRAAGGSSILLKALQLEYNLTTLNLRGQKLSTADVSELGHALVSLQYLSNLIISCTGLHCDQILALATEMCRDREKRYQLFLFRALEKLDISFNAIGDSSAGHLSRILVRCPQLRFLNLQCIAATAHFVHDHKASLREVFSGTSLTFVNLSRNRLGDAAADLQSIVNSIERYIELKLY